MTVKKSFVDEGLGCHCTYVMQQKRPYCCNIYNNLHFITSDILRVKIYSGCCCMHKIGACTLNKLYHLRSDYIPCCATYCLIYFFPAVLQCMHWIGRCHRLKVRVNDKRLLPRLQRVEGTHRSSFTYILLSIRRRVKVNINHSELTWKLCYTLSNTYIRSGITGLGHQLYS